MKLVSPHDERGEDGPRSAPNLISLPEELLTLIAGELDWKSIVRLRQTCSRLQAISCRREVWLIVLRRHLATTFPQPFFLKKPLEQCSGADIEDTVVNWEAAWSTTSAVPTEWRAFDVDKKKVEPNASATTWSSLFRATLSAVRLLPGGRFLICGYSDGSVRYFDLEESSSDITPKLLIATPFPKDQNESCHSVHIALDYRSEPLALTSKEARYLKAFNMAIEVDRTINVWRVEIESDSQDQSRAFLRAGAHLSSFFEPHVDVCGFDIFGSHLAYSVVGETRRDSCVAVIDWKAANGNVEEHDEKTERYFLPKTVAQDLTLLPSGTVLVANHDQVTKMKLFNWLTEGHVSTLTSKDQGFERVSPRWQHSFSNLNPRAISPPAIVSDDIRMVIPDDDGLHTLYIPLDHFSSPRLDIIQATPGEFGRKGRVQLFGYHRAVDFDLRNPEVCRAAQYAWPDEEQCRPFRFIQVDHDSSTKGVPKIIRPMFDQFSNTVVYMNFSLTRIVKLQLLIHDL